MIKLGTQTVSSGIALIQFANSRFLCLDKKEEILLNFFDNKNATISQVRKKVHTFQEFLTKPTKFTFFSFGGKPLIMKEKEKRRWTCVNVGVLCWPVFTFFFLKKKWTFLHYYESEIECAFSYTLFKWCTYEKGIYTQSFAEDIPWLQKVWS